MERAHELGLVCFSSPLDETAVDFLEGLGAPAYYQLSGKLRFLPLPNKRKFMRLPSAFYGSSRTRD